MVTLGYKKLFKFLKFLSLLWLLTVLPVTAKENTILVLGDSLSAAHGIPMESGWVNLLQKRLNETHPNKYTVINKSISGETTAGGLNRLASLLEAHKPSHVVVELGGNDGLRGLSLKAMQHNLQGIIDQSQQQGALVTLVSVDLPASYGLVFNRRFQQVFDHLAADNNIPRVKLSFGMLNDRNLLQEDGIHPTAAAQIFLLDAVWPGLDI